MSAKDHDSCTVVRKSKSWSCLKLLVLLRNCMIAVGLQFMRIIHPYNSVLRHHLQAPDRHANAQKLASHTKRYTFRKPQKITMRHECFADNFDVDARKRWPEDSKSDAKIYCFGSVELLTLIKPHPSCKPIQSRQRHI